MQEGIRSLFMQSQGWLPNCSVPRDEPFKADKWVPVYGGRRTHEKAYNLLAHIEDSHIDPLHETTTRPTKKKSIIQSSCVEKVHTDCASQVIPVLHAQGGSSDYSVHKNHSQGPFPGDIIARPGKQKTTVATGITGKEAREPQNEASHEQQTWGTAHAHQVQVETGSRPAPWDQKRKRNSPSAVRTQKMIDVMNSSTEGLQLSCSNRLAKNPTVPMDAEPTQLLNSYPHQNQSEEIVRIVTNVIPNSPPQQQVPQASHHELDDVGASMPPSSFDHCILQPECINNRCSPGSYSWREDETSQECINNRHSPGSYSWREDEMSQECINNRYSPGSYSWHEDEMSREVSYSADVQSIPWQTLNQVTNGQQAQLSIGEDNLEQVGVEHHKKNFGMHEGQSVATSWDKGQYDDAEYLREGDAEIVNLARCGSRSLPDVPLEEDQKPFLTPVWDTMWLVHDLDKNTRQPNAVIGCIVRERYPGMVKYKGINQHAENWKHYAAAPDPLGEKENLLERINADFWARYRWKDGFEAHAQRVVKNVVKREIQHVIYSARIHAVMDYFKKFQGIKIGERDARGKYLSKEEYMQVMPSWIQNCPDAWESFARKWSSETLKTRSMDLRKGRNMNRQPSQRQGSSSLLRLRQKKANLLNLHSVMLLPLKGFCIAAETRIQVTLATIGTITETCKHIISFYVSFTAFPPTM